MLSGQHVCKWVRQRMQLPGRPKGYYNHMHLCKLCRICFMVQIKIII